MGSDTDSEIAEAELAQQLVTIRQNFQEQQVTLTFLLHSSTHFSKTISHLVLIH